MLYDIQRILKIILQKVNNYYSFRWFFNLLSFFQTMSITVKTKGSVGPPRFNRLSEALPYRFFKIDTSQKQYVSDRYFTLTDTNEKRLYRTRSSFEL